MKESKRRRNAATAMDIPSFGIKWILKLLDALERGTY